MLLFFSTILAKKKNSTTKKIWIYGTVPFAFHIETSVLVRVTKRVFRRPHEKIKNSRKKKFSLCVQHAFGHSAWWLREWLPSNRQLWFVVSPFFFIVEVVVVLYYRRRQPTNSRTSSFYCETKIVSHESSNRHDRNVNWLRARTQTSCTIRVYPMNEERNKKRIVQMCLSKIESKARMEKRQNRIHTK